MATETSFEQLAVGPRGQVDQYLSDYLEQLELPESLRGAVRYALLGGGKRVRPILCWHCGVACGGDGIQTLPAGAAVELVHAFSLVHDDLPAMDDDDLRRGRPTLHRHSSEAMAILAGDAMLNFSSDIILRARMDDALRVRLLAELAVGTTGMIVGQVYDTHGGLEHLDSVLDELAAVHRNKTGALIRAACRMGALSCGATDDMLSKIDAYAEAIGLMFQIVDDLLDVQQTSEHIGKRTGKDSDAGKRTYPEVLGVEGSRREVERLESRAGSIAKDLGERASVLGELARVMAVRTR